jgi:hypothetical protein
VYLDNWLFSTIHLLYPGMPDGLFSNQKSQLEKNLKGLGVENVVLLKIGIFFSHLVYNLRSFGLFCGHLVYFFRLGMFGQRQIWQPCHVKNARAFVNNFIKRPNIRGFSETSKS